MTPSSARTFVGVLLHSGVSTSSSTYGPNGISASSCSLRTTELDDIVEQWCDAAKLDGRRMNKRSGQACPGDAERRLSLRPNVGGSDPRPETCAHAPLDALQHSAHSTLIVHNRSLAAVPLNPSSACLVTSPAFSSLPGILNRTLDDDSSPVSFRRVTQGKHHGFS